jgi:hypothetical protein
MGKWLIFGGLLVLLAAGCGGASTAAKTTTATSTTGTTASAAGQAFQNCLKQHGVTGAQAFRGRPGGAPPQGGTQTFTAPPQGQRPPRTAKQQQAFQACRSKLPPGQRFGAGRNRSAGGAAFAKYTACLKQHGVTFGVSSSAAKFKAASTACAKLRPKTTTTG